MSGGNIGSRLAFYPTLLYNLLLNKLAGRDWYSKVDDVVLVGALPFKSMSKELVEKQGVRGVISLNEDYELSRWVNSCDEWRALGVTAICLPTVDLTAAPSQASLRQGVEFIMNYKERKESVYVHCKAGRTRSATLSACYLMTSYKWDVQKALHILKMRRPHVWLRQKQLDALDTYYSENVEINK